MTKKLTVSIDTIIEYAGCEVYDLLSHIAEKSNEKEDYINEKLEELNII